MATQPQVLLKDADPVNLVATLGLASGDVVTVQNVNAPGGIVYLAEAAAAPDIDAPPVGAHVLRGGPHYDSKGVEVAADGVWAYSPGQDSLLAVTPAQ